ncbi:hypothetical protein LTR53_009277 [Teratosphaeriaceae sp. CCFEE 6253]|nr:hypothetical protein LTR53_009277 [Teratosphaeriaceae sp. CCFEE 6253]
MPAAGWRYFHGVSFHAQSKGVMPANRAVQSRIVALSLPSPYKQTAEQTPSRTATKVKKMPETLRFIEAAPHAGTTSSPRTIGGFRPLMQGLVNESSSPSKWPKELYKSSASRDPNALKVPVSLKVWARHLVQLLADVLQFAKEYTTLDEVEIGTATFSDGIPREGYRPISAKRTGERVWLYKLRDSHENEVENHVFLRVGGDPTERVRCEMDVSWVSMATRMVVDGKVSLVRSDFMVATGRETLMGRWEYQLKSDEGLHGGGAWYQSDDLRLVDGRCSV